MSDENLNITWSDLPLVWSDLRAMARKLLRQEGNARSVAATDLVITAVRRQGGFQGKEVTWSNRRQFFGYMRRSMKNALCDRARARQAQRRRETARIQLEDLKDSDLEVMAKADDPEQMVAFVEVLELLAGHDRKHGTRLAEIFEIHFFQGLNAEEIKAQEEYPESARTIRRDLERARVLVKTWLLDDLNADRKPKKGRS